MYAIYLQSDEIRNRRRRRRRRCYGVGAAYSEIYFHFQIDVYNLTFFALVYIRFGIKKYIL